MAVQNVSKAENTLIESMLRMRTDRREYVSAQQIREGASGDKEPIDPKVLIKIIKRALKELEKTATPKNV